MASTRASSRKSQPKQTRLSFTPLPSSSPQRPEAFIRFNNDSAARKKRRIDDLDSDSDIRQLSPDMAYAVALSRKQNIEVDVPSPRKMPSQLLTPAASSQIERGRGEGQHGGVNTRGPIHGLATKATGIYDHSSIESDEVAPFKARTNRKAISAPIPPVHSSSEDSEPITPSIKRTRAKHSSTASDSPPMSSRRRNTRSFLAGGTSGNAPIPQKAPRQKRRKRLVDSSDGGSDSILEEVEMSSPIKRTKRVMPRRQRGRISIDSASDGENDKAHGVAVIEKGKLSSKARKFKEVVELSDNSGLSEGIVVSPNLIKKQRSEEQREEDEDSLLDELEDEKEDLQDSDAVPQKRRTRGQQETSARSKRLAGLAKLKQRRAGIVMVETDDEEDQENQEQDENQSNEDHPPTQNPDEYESDFVEDDGEIGVDLMKHGVPLHLTGQANKKPFDYFKDVIEWMIHNKLDPAFERHDEIYGMAHRKLDDEIRGLAGSEFNSSVWTEIFVKALRSRPDLSSMHVGWDIMQDKCEACNRAKHPPKWSITLSGNTYDRTSLERIKTSNGDGSSSSSGTDEDEPEKEQTFALGSVCCGNAEVAHSLYHWRYHLNQTVLQWLACNGHTTAAKIIEREQWSRKKREKLANKVVDGMLESGEMRDLYLQFKQNLDAARAAKAERIER